MLSKKQLVPVIAGILSHNGKVLIARRKESAQLPGLWEFPGGKLEPGESPEQCLRRELFEELGIRASVKEFIGESIHHYDHISVRLLAFKAHLDGGNISLCDHDKYHWTSISEIDRYDFVQADVTFVDKLKRGEIVL